VAAVTRQRTGRAEILWLQSMGIMDAVLGLRGEVPWGGTQPRGLCHITLTDGRGEVIWRSGAPWAGEHPYLSHFADGMMAVDAAPGRAPRVLCLASQGGEGVLRFLDLGTGRMEGEVSLPRNDYTWVLCGRSDPARGGRTVVLTTQDVGYYAGGHGRHSALFLDGEGGVIREVEVPGDGHFPACFDADGDGWDEFMLGYDLFDHDGEHLWRTDYWRRRRINLMRQHADQVLIHRGLGEEGWTAVIPGSDALYRVDAGGRVLWRRRWHRWVRRKGVAPWPVRTHVQFVALGRLLANDEREYVFVLHNRFGMSLVDLEGRVVWRGKLPENWPGGRPACVEADSFHTGTPMVLWKNPLGTGQDLLVYNEAGWPYAVDGRGSRVVEFAWPAEARQADAFRLPGLSEAGARPPYRPDDWGYGYRCLTEDIDDDGRQEVLIFDRRHCWVYGLEDGAAR